MIYIILGVVIIVGVFIVGSSAVARRDGWRPVLESWAIAVVVIGLFVLGSWLIDMGVSTR